MKLGSGRRTRSRADGRNAGPGHLRRATRGPRRPIFSVQSVRQKEKVQGSSCPRATARPWPCISRKSQSRSCQARMPSFSSIRRDGMSRRSFPSRTTSRSCLFRRNQERSLPLSHGLFRIALTGPLADARASNLRRRHSELGPPIKRREQIWRQTVCPTSRQQKACNILAEPTN